MAMRIAPPSSAPSSYTHLASHSAPSAPGVHDILRAGVGPTTSHASTAVSLDSAHPLESRLAQWQQTQDALKLTTLRRTYGIAEPIRRGMELKIAREGEWRPLALGGGKPGVHEEILTGRDTTISWEDVFTGGELRGVQGFHEELESKVGMGKW